MLYPLKFRPKVRERPWGGNSLASRSYRKLPEDVLIGESWELSAVRGDLSVVTNGALKGNNIQELIEVYMGDLVGDKVYNRFGVEFPVLVKQIDARERLSVQVHPGDEVAAERHHSYGKTEMWYVTDAQPGAAIWIGMREGLGPGDYEDALALDDFDNVMNKIEVKKGDAFFIPAGTIHALGGGVRVLEIQQTSDVTYRISDWGRTDADGNARELHTGLAREVIDFAGRKEYAITRIPVDNVPARLVATPFFTADLLKLSGTLRKKLESGQSFTIFTCAEGSATVATEGGQAEITAGECVLVPAEAETLVLCGNATLLETYME